MDARRPRRCRTPIPRGRRLSAIGDALDGTRRGSDGSCAARLDPKAATGLGADARDGRRVLAGRRLRGPRRDDPAGRAAWSNVDARRHPWAASHATDASLHACSDGSPGLGHARSASWSWRSRVRPTRAPVAPVERRPVPGDRRRRGSSSLSNAIKVAVGRVRPDAPPLHVLPGPSFPSGHATAAAATWAAVALVLGRGARRGGGRCWPGLPRRSRSPWRARACSSARTGPPTWSAGSARVDVVRGVRGGVRRPDPATRRARRGSGCRAVVRRSPCGAGRAHARSRSQSLTRSSRPASARLLSRRRTPAACRPGARSGRCSRRRGGGRPSSRRPHVGRSG